VLLQHLTDEFGEQSKELTRNLAERDYAPTASGEPRMWIAWVALVAIVVLVTVIATLNS